MAKSEAVAILTACPIRLGCESGIASLGGCECFIGGAGVGTLAPADEQFIREQNAQTTFTVWLQSRRILTVHRPEMIPRLT